MPVSVAEFVQAAQDSGILTPEVLAEFAQDVAPKADATPLANRLVKAGRLSAFQAKYIYGGKAKSLLLGPYVVLDVLGKGGMGYVYKAEHRKMRRVVALKVIARAALQSPDAVRRFEREVQAAARLEHPNIVTAFDAGEASGTHYLVMQYVEGRNLSEVVKELGPQPLGRTVDWILQAARGLAFAHEQGVIHRDIKPGNLLVDSRGTVKILDMGLARLENLDADQDQLTGTGQIMGTVDYMAPEQAVDTRQADARADIYSLGVTLWYLLTARPLFAGDTAMNKMMAHMQTPVPPLASERGHVPPAVEAAFQRMVAKRPVDRFQSMREVIAALGPAAGCDGSRAAVHSPRRRPHPARPFRDGGDADTATARGSRHGRAYGQTRRHRRRHADGAREDREPDGAAGVQPEAAASRPRRRCSRRVGARRRDRVRVQRSPRSIAQGPRQRKPRRLVRPIRVASRFRRESAHGGGNGFATTRAGCSAGLDCTADDGRAGHCPAPRQRPL
jgi:predicted Ser/Thr protein kinase